ncbi:hypothetical protein FGKAn22_15630 [Ferrigenium kumadai]|uniref:Uncharacterized protein n=1 Tax=Ferrigenium kumadai TaxID=1682490 RepID=A0AAN1T0Z5_9PROT|nr:hypothetical protein [Ferrigenium kumadai]BBI99870.1 hypothetical protein FGKAn22_15630 [Ferrigenium kumadai]
MVINNATATPLSQPVNTPQPAASRTPAPQSAKPAQGQQDSSVVKLSAQAQQMNRAETQTNINTERAETRPQEMKEPPGIQFMAGEERNGRINTYA